MSADLITGLGTSAVHSANGLSDVLDPIGKLLFFMVLVLLIVCGVLFIKLMYLYDRTSKALETLAVSLTELSTLIRYGRQP